MYVRMTRVQSDQMNDSVQGGNVLESKNGKEQRPSNVSLYVYGAYKWSSASWADVRVSESDRQQRKKEQQQV